MASVTNEWVVKDELLQQFKSASNKQKFNSPSFRSNDGTFWRIQCFPNGYNESAKDNCSIFLESVKLASDKKQIGVNYLLEVDEINWKTDLGSTFKKDGKSWGFTKAFEKSKIENIQQLTIKAIVQETMDFKY
eukprot:133409_1